jgi:hypothetical protein
MIFAVSLRLLHLIFQHMLGLLLLMARTSSKGHRAPRAGEGLVVRGPLRRVGADIASPSTPSRAITPSELRPTVGGAGGVGTATGVTVAMNSA